MKRILCVGWNPRSSVWIRYYAARDLLHLHQLLKSSAKLMWHRPISLLIPRYPHFVGQSDAYNIAMGGLCFPLLIQWRLFNSVFRCLPEWRAAPPNKPSFYINIHDLIALIVNNFFMMISFTNLHYQGSPILTNIDLWIFLLEAYNTSTLRWMSILSLTQQSHILNIYHLLSHIIFYFNTMCPYRFNGQHIEVILNVEEDALSHPQ